MAIQSEPITITRQGKVSVNDLVIKTESDNERALATVRKLMSRQDRTPEEDALFQILSVEIESFESKTYAQRKTNPAELIRFLLEENDLSAKDLAGILGGKSHVSEILSGKRKVGIKQAVRLGKHFHISPAVFLPLE
jgi:HTH-type transcriptional regulator / antitoxin HigA